MSFLGVDENFYVGLDDRRGSNISCYATCCAAEGMRAASAILQDISTEFTRVGKLKSVKRTLNEIKRNLPENFLWGGDHLLPVFLFVVIRAEIKNLGSEIHFIEDLMDSHLKNGELGYMLITLKASYYQIINETNWFYGLKQIHSITSYIFIFLLEFHSREYI